MRIFAESNFLLELAFEQQEQPACQLLLQAAEQGIIQLCLPVHSLTEVFQTLSRRRTQREEARQYIREEVRQYLRESGSVATDADTLLYLLNDLLQARTATQTARLFTLAERLARIATLIPLTAAVLQVAPLLQEQHGLSPHDALVYASVRSGLQEEAAEANLFILRDAAAVKLPIFQQLSGSS